MRSSGSAATCVPVQLSGTGTWEAALFIHVAGPECKQDRRLLKTAAEPTPSKIKPKLMAHERAAIVSLELSVITILEDPLKFEVLLVPGSIDAHYQSLKLLAEQNRICWFFADNDFRVIQAQEQEIEKQQHHEFEGIARDAFAHDSLLRMANHYDNEAALAEIVSHYTPRSEADLEKTQH